VAGCCECDIEPSGSCATELVSHNVTKTKYKFSYYGVTHMYYYEQYTNY
jgi:hypothetical protein